MQETLPFPSLLFSLLLLWRRSWQIDQFVRPSVRLLDGLSLSQPIFNSTNHLSACSSINLSIFLSIYLSMYRPIYLSIYLSVYLFTYLSISICICRYKFVSILWFPSWFFIRKIRFFCTFFFLFVYLSILFIHMWVCMHVSNYLFTHQSIYVCINLFNYLFINVCINSCISLSIYLCVYLCLQQFLLPSFDLFRSALKKCKTV